MKHVFTLSLLAVFVLAFSINAQDFTRTTTIDMPEATANNGGVGNMISGVDVDGDGKTEIYLVNDNWSDGTTEVIPRIYKLEKDGDAWSVVWSAVAPVQYQNTWPTLSLTDLDNDGKQELAWGVVNSTGLEANPDRILVYEHLGGDSDAFGIATEATNANSGEALGYAPNAKNQLLDADGANMRIVNWKVADIDDDGADEILIADRKGYYHFAAISVSDIPDNGDGSETWTIEVSSGDFTYAGDNKWDVAVIGNSFYTFDEVKISKTTWNGSAWEYAELDPLPGGISFDAVQVADIDNDGQEEMITGEYYYGDATRHLWLLQEDADSLKRTPLFDISGVGFLNGGRLIGGAQGDIDGDGYLDFVFGSRFSDPKDALFRLSYRGGDITDPANYKLSVIDSEFLNSDQEGIWNIINLANIDADPELEVLYGSSRNYATGVFPAVVNVTPPIVVLDYVPLEFDNLIVAPEVLLNGETPSGLNFKPGRILDDGNTIWFCGSDGAIRGTYVFRSIDGGATFTHNAAPLDGRPAQMDAFDATTAIVSTANGKIYRTEDGGVGWTEVYSYMLNPLGAGWFDGCRVLNDSVAVCFGDMEPNGNMHFVRSTDKGATWTEIAGIDYRGAAYGYYTFGLAACNVGESIWCAATSMEYDSSYVFRSYDAGLTWDAFHIPTDVIASYPRSITFLDDNNGMISDRRGNVVRTTDGGETWVAANKPDTTASGWVNGVVTIPGTDIILGMDDVGVFFTTDLGHTWGAIETPSETDSDYIVSGLFASTDMGFVFTDNGLVLRLENQITGISDKEPNTTVSSYMLFQNYPNPFNPTTQISFSLLNAADVKVVVFNMLGQKVRTILDGHKQIGTHTVSWDGRNDAGQSVSSGTYIYKLSGKNINLSKRMVFIK